MKPEIIDIIRDRREREAAGDRDPWTWRDIARLCWAATANNLNHEIIEGFAEGDNWRVQHGLLAWDNIEDSELRKYVEQTDWLLPDPSDETLAPQSTEVRQLFDPPESYEDYLLTHSESEVTA